MSIVRTAQPAAYAAISVRLSRTIVPCANTDGKHSVNEEVRIRLKWGTAEYTGQLVSVDSYMNIQLSNAEEYMNGKSTGSLGQVLIR